MKEKTTKSKRGGYRPGSGRKKGTKNPATLHKEALLDEVIVRAVEGEKTPLEVMLEIMRAPETPAMMKFEAAKAAAPYVHPRLSQTDSTVMHKYDAVDYSREELIAIASGARDSGAGQRSRTSH